MVAGERIVHRPAYPARKKYFLPAENAVGPADRSLSRAQLLRWELGHFSKHLASSGMADPRERILK